jgi:hypothetical protein
MVCESFATHTRRRHDCSTVRRGGIRDGSVTPGVTEALQPRDTRRDNHGTVSEVANLRQTIAPVNGAARSFRRYAAVQWRPPSWSTGRTASEWGVR